MAEIDNSMFGVVIDIDEMIQWRIDKKDAPFPGTSYTPAEAAKESETFVDYAPPPRPPVPPPAKYKLCVVIWVLVYFVVWFAEKSGIVPAFIEGGLNPNGAIFCQFMIEIFVMVFCGVELVVGLTRVKIGGTWYGTLPWFMQPRLAPRLRQSENVFVEFLAVIVGLLEDGFAIFNPPVIPPPPPKIRVFDLMDASKEAVLRAQHNVDPAKLQEYEEWTKFMIQHMESQPGFVAAEKEGVDDNGVHTWKLRFETVHDLNACMVSPAWVQQVGELQSLLNAPKVTQILMEHPPVNAFMDLLTQQGQSTPALPPKKWKVWWLTTLSIYFSALIMNVTLTTYFARWGWTDWNENVYRLLQIGCIVLILNYIASPGILLLVHTWMIRKPDENDTKFPWKQLNDGVPPPIQIIGFLAYFVSTGVVWATK